uniref:non-specific serine/threonine protein kinase n=1 Tax=Oryza punctata TaxID=4537 RepID=A0A0E0M044_ORYPU
MAWRLVPRGWRKLFLVVLGLLLLGEVHHGSGARTASLPRLLPAEVRTLRRIAQKMGISRWNFSVDPCNSGGNGGFGGTLNCDCSFYNHTFCRVTNISLGGQNFTGELPPDFAEFPNLLQLDLSRSVFHGGVPDQWARMKLQGLSLMGNNLSGPFPTALTKITTLTNLSIEGNNFYGPIPSDIGHLVQMEKLFYFCNVSTTEIDDRRISGNNFSGRVPVFLEKLIKLVKLQIEGSLLEGPIPSGFSKLIKLTDLRLYNMNLFECSILRNCSISGSIPFYIGNMGNLKHLYLTGNSLTGSIPEWILKRNKIATNVQSCLKRNFPCGSSNGQYRYSLNINCGDKEVTINRTKYEADVEPKGASLLYLSPGSNWAFSSTGNFMDNNISDDSYIATSTSKLAMPNSELYAKARLSPLSLAYYGLCMHNGSYTVKLHFAEIVFTNDSTYCSLGKRRFNVFIQGRMVLEDFDIEQSAGGAAKAVIKTFTTDVTNHTLEIRFYWAGRGTTGIPKRGYYGPIISAISVVANFEVPLAVEPPQIGGSKKLSRISKAFLVAVPILAMFAALFVCIYWIKWRRKNSMHKDLRAFDLQTGSFTLRQIKAATRNFDAANKIGEGGFGSVYKGLLSDGTIIAVKQLSSRSKQGNREFVNEIGMISALQHSNLVKLYGCCTEGNQLLLVYEYMENNCLARALFGTVEQYRLSLDWPTRRKICLGIARGLAYLHEESAIRIVHRDIKASNVLLDKDLSAKISDFGLAKLNDDDHTHISTRIAGTIGYMAPEYAMRGYLTDKADVYSFGVVALEIVSGKSNTSYRPKEDFVYLLDWACVLHERGNLLELVDPELGSDYSPEEALLMLNVALLCTNAAPTLRPKMSKVVSLLEGNTPLQPFLSDLSLTANSLSSSGLRRNFWQTLSDQSQSMTAQPSSSNTNESSSLDIDGSLRP